MKKSFPFLSCVFLLLFSYSKNIMPVNLIPKALAHQQHMVNARQAETIKKALSAYSLNIKRFTNIFTAHPHAHEMTYWSHATRALKLSVKMGYGSFCLFIHALCPFLFETVGSETIKELYEEINNAVTNKRYSSLI